MRARWPLLVGVAMGTLAADQAAKAAAVHLLSAGGPRLLIGHWLRLTLTRNTGGAFGLLRGATTELIVASIIIAAALAVYARAAVTHSALLTVAVAMLLGGALGNLVDRVRLGQVIDFIDLRVWPVFNIADIAVTVGVALIILAAVLPRRRRE